MAGIQVEIKGLSLLQKQIGALDAAGMAKVLKASVNKGVKAARTEASAHITAKFTVKKKSLFTGATSRKKSDKLQIILANNGYFPEAMLYAKGGRLEGLRYTEFKHSVTKTGVNVWEYRGRKGSLKTAWKMKFPNGSAEGIFWRAAAGSFPFSGKKRTPQQYRAMPSKYRKPVEHLRGFSAAQMLDEGTGVEKARKRGEEVFLAEVDRLMELRLNGTIF